jgi:hypothetical protein
MDAEKGVHCLQIPLFHATSTLFESSIREFGLGGRDLLRELGIREAAVELLRYADRACPPSGINVDSLSMSAHELLEDLISHSSVAPETDEVRLFTLLRVCYGLAKKADRRPDVGCANFRYGQIYATVSRDSALSWTRNVEFGSEALTNVIDLFRVLAQRFPELRESSALSKILEFTMPGSRPLLVEIVNAPIDDLRTDRGEAPDEYLRMCDETSPHSQLSFEIVKTIPCEQLLIHDLDSL